MSTKKKVLAISGSTRENSSSFSILNHISKAHTELIDLVIFKGIDKLPHFNPDLDNENLPEVVADFRTQIEAADAIIISTPEYVFSLPGSLKNAIEWNVSTTLFSNKPVALIVASASGEKALESLFLIMNTLESKIHDNAKLLIQGIRGKIDQKNEIIDEQTISNLKILVESLLTSIDLKKQTSSIV